MVGLYVIVLHSCQPGNNFNKQRKWFALHRSVWSTRCRSFTCYPTIIAVILSPVWGAGHAASLPSHPTATYFPARRQHKFQRYQSRIYGTTRLSGYGMKPLCSIVFAVLIGWLNPAAVAHGNKSTLGVAAAKLSNSLGMLQRLTQPAISRLIMGWWWMPYEKPM